MAAITPSWALETTADGEVKEKTSGPGGQWRALSTYIRTFSCSSSYLHRCRTRPHPLLVDAQVQVPNTYPKSSYPPFSLYPTEGYPWYGQDRFR